MSIATRMIGDRSSFTFGLGGITPTERRVRVARSALPCICEVVFDEMAFPLVDDGFNLKYTKSYRRIGGKVLVLLLRMIASIQGPTDYVEVRRDPRQTPLALAERL